MDAVAGEFVGDGVVLAVDATKNPMAAEGCEALRHVVAFREERARAPWRGGSPICRTST